MSSTDGMSATDDALRTRLDAFFRDKLAPAAEALRARGVHFYTRGREAGSGSAWSAPPAGEDFERFDSPAELLTALAEQWRSEGLPELAALAPELAALAEELELSEEDSEEVSPFVYVMY